jgi:Rrf2 family protein
MRLSRSAGYAIQAVFQLAQGDGKTPISSQQLALESDMPVRFLLTILSKLVKRDILKSRRGTDGGYLLARRSEDISLLQLIEAVDGPITDVWIQPSVRGQRNGHRRQGPSHQVTGHHNSANGASASGAFSPNGASARGSLHDRGQKGRGFVDVIGPDRRNGNANGHAGLPPLGKRMRGAFVKLTDATRELYDSITIHHLVHATRVGDSGFSAALERLSHAPVSGDARNWVI